MSDEREWWPEPLLDEVMPPGRADPSLWLRALSYGKCEVSDGGACSDDDSDGTCATLAPGDRLDFCSCDRLGDLDVTFHADGTFEAHGAVPAEHNWCRIAYDQDTMQESLEALAKYVAEDAPWLLEEEGGCWTVQFARWSEAMPFELVVEDGKPRFVAATKALE